VRSADESASLGGVEHDGRGLAVADAPEPDERWLPGGADVRAVQVCVEDERRPELRGERGQRTPRSGALLERAQNMGSRSRDAR
jgi:hypothetical protein